MKITSKYTEIWLNQVIWMFFNLKQQSCCLYIVEKPVISLLPQKYIKFWYFNHFYQISQKALGGFWWNHAFFNPWKALFKTYYVSSFENCKKILTPSRPVWRDYALESKISKIYLLSNLNCLYLLKFKMSHITHHWWQAQMINCIEWCT